MCVGSLTVAEQTTSDARSLSVPLRPQDARPRRRRGPSAGCFSVRDQSRPISFRPQDGWPKARPARACPTAPGGLRRHPSSRTETALTTAINRTLKHPAEGRFAPSVLWTQRQRLRLCPDIRPRPRPIRGHYPHTLRKSSCAGESAEPSAAGSGGVARPRNNEASKHERQEHCCPCRSRSTLGYSPSGLLRLQHRQVVVQLVLRDLDPVLVPLDPLVLDELGVEVRAETILQ